MIDKSLRNPYHLMGNHYRRMPHFIGVKAIVGLCFAKIRSVVAI